MNFWRKGSSQPQRATSTSKRGDRIGGASSSALTNSLNSTGNAATNRPPSIIRPSANVSNPTMPSRRQRMQLLKRIIHHADKVQNEYLVPKSNAVEQDNTTAPKPMIMNSILVRRDADVTVINEKCFQRWHQVLQEGLVPLSVVGLNLLQKSTCNIGGSEGVSDEEKEEEAYFASLDGMEEEIQVMAILARAAALSDYAADTNIEHGMEQIHAVMKCIAMLLFHIVLDASSSGSQTTKENVAGATSTNEARKSVAGYDGRIRHVVKLASVDVLACAIVEVVINSSQEDGRSSGAVYNVDDYSSWDISSLKSFLDQTDVGKDAIFGTLFKPPTASVSESGTSVSDGKEHSNENQEDAQTRPDSCEEVIITDEMSLNAEAKFVNSAASSCLLTDVSSVEALDDAVDSSDVDQEETVRESCSIVKSEAWNDQNAEVDGGSENHENEDAELHSRRLFNAQFLATRKFELIERIVAIEIVRFFMAEERELKICRKVPGDVSSMPVDTTTNPDADASEQDKSTNSKYFSSHQIKRGVKIAGAGLALGTVFAVTGGLAAPALAAAIGGITALTGATTATSTALLALLATFKAGAALFGVGGGGLAAYKMNKRTAGLSDFEIRRENIEQYMYLGAPDEKMKKGIEAMLPQLHTTVAVSGWLRDKDKADFQLAWGVQPTCQYDKSEEDTIRIRKMKRFYSIYNPPLVHSCEAFMQILQSKLKRNFSWDRIWHQMENKYGANPDHMIPLPSSISYLSHGEKELIDGVLNAAKIANLNKRGLVGIGCNDKDEIDDLLARTSPTKRTRNKLDFASIENEFDMKSDLDLSESEDRVAATTYTGTGAISVLSEQNDVAMTHYRRVSSSTIDSQKHGKDENQDAIMEHEGESRPVVWDWTRLYGTADVHTVTWESKMLSSLCHIVEKMAFEISGQATRVALQFSVIGAVLSAIMIPSALATATKFIDDPYQIVVIRADAAGKELAKCLLQSDERRPVTLVGFSFGARVVYSCLRELARQQDLWEESRISMANSSTADTKGSQSSLLSKSGEEEHQFKYDREPASLVADVIFIGLPRAIDEQVLTSCRRVTGGRFVHCYTRNDWFLTLMFIARAGTPCGIKPITNVPGVENFDITHLVESHTKYADAIPRILQYIRFAEP